MNTFSFFDEAKRLIKDKLTRRFPVHYKGNYREISEQVIRDRWNGRFIEAGRELHLNQFWIRDFGQNVDGMIHLGFKDEVCKTLDWAINLYKEHGHTYTTISTTEVPYDVYHYAADSLPMLLHCLTFESNKPLLEKYREFIQQEIFFYYDHVLDKQKLMISPTTVFSIPKDVVLRKSTCVANIFLCYTAKLLEEKFDFENPFPKSEYLIENLLKNFWNGEYLVNDLQSDGIKIISSDPTIWFFRTGLSRDKELLKKMLDWLKVNKFADPFPVKYHNENFDHLAPPAARVFLPNYQGNAIWTMSSVSYIRFLNSFYPEEAREVLKKFIGRVEADGNYFELYEPDGSGPLKGRFGFKSGTGMSWISGLPKLVEEVMPEYTKLQLLETSEETQLTKDLIPDIMM